MLFLLNDRKGRCLHDQVNVLSSSYLNLVSTVYESRQQKEVSIDETLYLYLYTVTWGNLYGN